MFKIKNAEDIYNLSYTDYISLIKEENRPSGGKNTIRLIAQNSFISEKSKVLEIGCTNGFSSLELCRITGCSVTGIDINENSIKNANGKKTTCKKTEKAVFLYADAGKLPFKENSYDLVMCGNALSFIDNKTDAISEIKRVLKDAGMVSLVPIWYKEKPPAEVVESVSEVLGFNINCTYKKDWINFSAKNNMELYYWKDFAFKYLAEKEISDKLVAFFNNKKFLNQYSNDIVEAIMKRWYTTVNIFNENLKYTNFSIILYRKNNIEEEVEFFSGYEI